jgi:hypothetical protein
MTRMGIPESKKSIFLRSFFELNKNSCHFDYLAAKKDAGVGFMEYTEQINIELASIHYDFLTDFGKKELTFMLAYIHQMMEAKRVSNLGPLASILMIYISPEEVFKILKLLVERSDKIKMRDNLMHLRNKLGWHVATDEDDHAQLISTFIDSYISLKKNGNRRQVLVKFYELQYNFDFFVHQMMNSLLTVVIPIDFAIPVIFNYLIEGQKGIFKSMYGLIKSNKQFIVSLNSKDQLM